MWARCAWLVYSLVFSPRRGGRGTRVSLDANERVRLEKVDRGKKLGSEEKQNTNPRLNPDVAAFAIKTKTVQMQHGMNMIHPFLSLLFSSTAKKLHKGDSSTPPPSQIEPSRYVSTCTFRRWTPRPSLLPPPPPIRPPSLAHPKRPLRRAFSRRIIASSP